ncbi:unnamed protein product, partial [Mesorhabditis belari]|uniref:EIF-4F 25 kDa subunit n=1 Tax=Mesorhabditis belari TaxID=2138241 RepID=A0AAF3EEM1_9BILA
MTDSRELAVTEKPCGPDEHPLQHTYEFSYFFRPAGVFNPEDYSKYVQTAAIVNSVEQFWRVYCHMVRPCDFVKKGELHFFKKDIKPTWEDEENKKGGKSILRIKKGTASRIWENLLMAIIGEQFDVEDDICGAVCSVRRDEDIISIWNRSADDFPIRNRIRDTLGQVLNLPAGTLVEYKRHDDCLKDKSSYRHSRGDVYEFCGNV